MGGCLSLILNMKRVKLNVFKVELCKHGSDAPWLALSKFFWERVKFCCW